MSWYGNDFPYTAQAIALNTPSKSGVYVIWWTDTTIYVGESNDLARRLLAHQKAQSTCINNETPTTCGFELVACAALVRIRPAIFPWRQTEPELILCAVRWSLRDSLSFRDGEERLRERGLEADHTTIWRWVQHDGPELEERLRRHLKPTKRSWRVDETDVCVRGRWGYLSRALDSAGATIDFVRSGWRAAAAANRLFRQALPDSAHPRHDGGHAATPPAHSSSTATASPSAAGARRGAPPARPLGCRPASSTTAAAPPRAT